MEKIDKVEKTEKQKVYKIINLANIDSSVSLIKLVKSLKFMPVFWSLDDLHDYEVDYESWAVATTARKSYSRTNEGDVMPFDAMRWTDIRNLLKDCEDNNVRSLPVRGRNIDSCDALHLHDEQNDWTF